MNEFKSNTKMQCFKEGGQVSYKSRRSTSVSESKDITQDKKLIKKAFSLHDSQEHKGEKTDLSTLKKGGRAKKAVGTVNKYKTGGAVENAYGAKKSDKDIKDIANTKRQKPAMLCGGKSVKKMADGRLSAPLAGQGAVSNAERAALLNALPGKTNDLERARMAARSRNAMRYLGPAQQSEFVQQGGMNPAPTNVGAPAGSTIPAQKRGGKVKGKK